MAYIIVLVQRNKLKYWYVKTWKLSVLSTLLSSLLEFIVLKCIIAIQSQLAHTVPHKVNQNSHTLKKKLMTVYVDLFHETI